MPPQVQGASRGSIDARDAKAKMEDPGERGEEKVHWRRGVRHHAQGSVFEIVECDRLSWGRDNALGAGHSGVAVRVGEVNLPARKNLPQFQQQTARVSASQITNPAYGRSFHKNLISFG